ncbi:MAG: SPOR domain-containing protein [Myxococcales bacterium]|nr:SPOR domain-containing protein [Myxococcales bacterium]
MSLRDFDRVRERWELHLERRHVAQLLLVLCAVVGGAFYAGWQMGLERQPAQPVTRVVAIARTVTAPPLPAPMAAAVESQRPPVLPTPVESTARAKVMAARRAVKLAPMLKDAAQGSGRAAVASDRYAKRPRLAEAEADAEHTAAREAPPVMLGALPSAAIKARRITTKSVALHEAFADRPATLTHGELPAEMVQSRGAVSGALSTDPSLERGRQAPSLGLVGGLDAAGRELQTQRDAGGFSVNRPTHTPAPIDRRRAAKLLADFQARIEAKARAKTEKLRLEQEAAERVRLQKLAAIEAAKQAKAQTTELALQAKKAAEIQRLKKIADTKASRAAANELRLKKLAEAKTLRLQNETKAKAAKQAAQVERRKSQQAIQAKKKAPLAAKTTAKTTAKPTTLQKPVAAKATADKRLFWVQIKSLKDGNEAKVFATKLRAKGYKLTVKLTQVPSLGAFHRVRLGPFQGQAKAKQAQQRFMKREGMEAMVMKASASR